MKLLIALLVMIILSVVAAKPVEAANDPVLFSCQNPVGNVIASYSSGTHGIPGDTNTYTGSDKVYKIDEMYVLQCFCPDNGNTGTQSNWYKANQLSSNDIDTFVRRGWIYVPNGSQWGLDSSPYIVKNDGFSCQGVGGGSTGQVLGASTLAATGSAQHIALFLTTGLGFAFLAYRLSRN